MTRRHAELVSWLTNLESRRRVVSGRYAGGGFRKGGAERVNGDYDRRRLT